MDAENKKSDAEEILAEFQKTHQTETKEPILEPEVENTPEPEVENTPEPEVENTPEPEQKSTDHEQTTEKHDVIFIGTKSIMDYVSATLTQLASFPIVTIKARGKRITQAIEVSQMIVKRMDQVGFEIVDVRNSSSSLTSKDGQKRNVASIEIDMKNTSIN